VTFAPISKSDATLLVAASAVSLFLLDGFFRAPLYSWSPAAFWLFDFAKFLVIPALGLCLLYRFYSLAPRHYGVRIPEQGMWGEFLGLSVFLTLMLAATYFAPVVLTARMSAGPEPSSFQALIPTGTLRVPVAVYFAATAGIAEEIMFRGLPLLYVVSRSPDRVPTAAYCLVTALLFASAHWENGANEVIGTFIYGLFASAFYVQVRDLSPFIVAHALGDLTWFLN